ncbi:MAG: hypothetical protein JXA20_14325 [Spirochaetes bacterium]|nr:hypothetical protein [Spirochaetota bacterium]
MTRITVPLVNNYIKIIQRLGRRGRGSYQQYLVDPLTRWSPEIPEDAIGRLLDLIEAHKRKNVIRLPSLYKQALVKSVSPEQLDLSMAGRLAVGFLNSMKNIRGVGRSTEALEFVNILKRPFREFSDSEYKQMNRIFQEKMTAADGKMVEELVEPAGADGDAQMQLREKSKQAAGIIMDRLRHYDAHELTKAVTDFLITYAVPSMPDLHHSIDPVFQKIRNGQSVLKEIMNGAAILIYHEILKAIQEGNLKGAVKNIGKYTLLFQGDTDTPYYQEVDSFEKKFYEIIEQKNLWERL